MGYGLPKNVEIDGKEYEIRYDFRVIQIGRASCRERV